MVPRSGDTIGYYSKTVLLALLKWKTQNTKQNKVVHLIKKCHYYHRYLKLNPSQGERGLDLSEVHYPRNMVHGLGRKQKDAEQSVKFLFRFLSLFNYSNIKMCLIHWVRQGGLKGLKSIKLAYRSHSVLSFNCVNLGLNYFF